MIFAGGRNILATVGIPQALAYHFFFPFWQTLLKEIGTEIVVSSQTTKAVLDQGVLEASNDLCIPLKIYHGHVAQLRDKVDMILIPRWVSIKKVDTFCPKFLGLPEIIKYSMEDLPPLISPRIDTGKHPFSFIYLIRQIANFFSCSPIKAARAMYKALQTQRSFRQLMLEGQTSPEAMKVLLVGDKKENHNSKMTGAVNIAVLGYPYSLYDDYLNGNILKKLSCLGVKILTPEMVPYHILIQKAAYFPKDLFWHFSNRVLWAGMYFLEQPTVDGIIHLSNFACGPDAMVNKLLELETKRWQRPFLTVTLDEHTGQAGIHTRVEAFIDMVLWRRGLKLNENNLSLHG